MATELAKAVAAGAHVRWQTATAKRPLSHRDLNWVAGRPDKWATVVFQVFWWPPPVASKCPVDLGAPEAAVLLGEAFAPPLASLSPDHRTYRLPLHQFGRRTPEGAQSFDKWQAEFLPRYLINLRIRADEQRAIEAEEKVVQGQDAMRRRAEELKELERDLAIAFPGSKLLGQAAVENRAASEDLPLDPRAFSRPSSPRQEPQEQPPCIQRLRLGRGRICPSAQRPEGVAASTPRSQTGALLGGQDVADVLAGLPAGFRGQCCLDVDLAFLGPEDPRRATAEGHDGVLAFSIRTLRAPPLDHGSVRVRVCEVGDVPSVPCKVAAGSALGALLSARHNLQALTPPLLPPTRPLWSSASIMLGSAGSGCVPRCSADWPSGTASASLWISDRTGLMRRHQQGMLDDSHRDAVGPKGETMIGPPPVEKAATVAYEWVPVRLTAPEPTPRSAELLEVEAMLDPTSSLLSPSVEVKVQDVMGTLRCQPPSTPRPRSAARRPQWRRARAAPS
eukprot:TRINITY_DN35641_c0_g1_i1.p1 TRINITY_DN35641_c0_g1~~TRINITY_DN35641_c0_g1_i1.p1  ORF type:complete len:505 (-),score=84.68 TRINITY_DN35641_c0_g1_i1:44-1558(-)